MYDLNQIPCDYTVKVTNNFKWLDLIDRVRPEELWMGVHDIVQEKAEEMVKKKKKRKKPAPWNHSKIWSAQFIANWQWDIIYLLGPPKVL